MSNTQEKAKKEAAYKSVEEHVNEHTKCVGIGSGSTVVYVVERLAKLVEEKKLNKIICVPTSFQSKQLILEHPNTLQLSTLDEHNELDVCIDGADEVDHELNLIKGGGGCLFQEKLVASCAKKLIIVADYRKKSEQLGSVFKKGVPIEVLPMSYVPVMKKISQKFSQIKPVLRMAGESKAGPVVTDNGNFILDLQNTAGLKPVELEQGLKQIVGVIETGLFINMAQQVYFGEQDGTTTTWKC